MIPGNAFEPVINPLQGILQAVGVMLMNRNFEHRGRSRLICRSHFITSNLPLVHFTQ